MQLFDDPGPPRPVSSPPATERLKLTVAYDGTEFHGFAAQRDVRTVEGALSDALAKVVRTSVPLLGLTCAGRTDAGVHAWGQVVSIDVPAGTDVDVVARSVTRLLGP